MGRSQPKTHWDFFVKIMILQSPIQPLGVRYRMAPKGPPDTAPQGTWTQTFRTIENSIFGIMKRGSRIIIMCLVFSKTFFNHFLILRNFPVTPLAFPPNAKQLTC